MARAVARALALVLALALALALGPMPKPNLNQVAEFIPNLQEAMCRRQEAAEARHCTHHVAALLCRVGGAARRARWASVRALSCAV